MTTVYLVRRSKDGAVYVVMAHDIDAESMREELESSEGVAFEVEERTLYCGQPPVCGYNK